MSQANRAGPQMGSLVICGKTFPLYQGLNLIGRSKSATVILKNENVSHHQAIIVIIDDSQHFLSDVFSSNGTVLEKRKLDPLKIYALEQDNVIEFANMVGIYKKVSGAVNDDPTNRTSNKSSQSTQNTDDSIYLADTQALEQTPVPPISEAHHNGYFDDGYDFNILPSPPSVTVISPNKTGLSIHEMSTQLYSVVRITNIDNEIEITKTGKTLSIHDCPTQLVGNGIDANVSDAEFVASDEVTLPINAELHSATSSCQVSVGVARVELLKPVQDNELDNTLVPNTQESPLCKRDEQLDVSIDVIDQSAVNDSGIDACNSKIDVHNKSSLTLVESTPCKQISNKSSSKHVTTTDTFMEMDESQEIGLVKKKCRPLPDSEGDTENIILQNRNSHLTETSQTLEIGYKRKPVRQIDSDSDTEAENDENTAQKTGLTSHLEIAQDNQKLKKRSSDSDINNDDNKLVEKSSCSNKNNESSKIDSDSEETDIELENNSDPKNKNDSGSETDIESDSTIDKGLRDKRTTYTTPINESKTISSNKKISIKEKDEACEHNNESNVSKISSDDDTFFIPATQHSDDDSNDFNFMQEKPVELVNNDKENKDNSEGSVLDISQKLNELKHQSFLQQNCSEESIQFCLTDVDSTKEITNKVSDVSVTNSNNNLTRSDENSSNVIITAEKQLCILNENTQETEDDLKQGKNSSTGEAESIFQPKHSPINQIVQDAHTIISNSDNKKLLQKKHANEESTTEHLIPNKKSQHEDYSIFDEPTQKIMHSQMSTTCDNDIFLLATQKVTVEENNICTSPNVEKCNTENVFTTSTPTNLNENEIFLQATQKIDYEQIDKADTRTFLKPLSIHSLLNKSVISKSVNNEDDIFLHPTQVLSIRQPDNTNLNDDDDIFLQPTQELSGIHVSDTAIKNPNENVSRGFKGKNLVINPNIFINSMDCITNTKVLENNDEDIFLQPTQVLMHGTVSTMPTEDVDISQQLLQNSLSSQDNIFLQPTQELNIVPETAIEGASVEQHRYKEVEDDAVDDIFLQPTQVLEPFRVDNSARSSLSLLHKIPEGKCEDDENESQLEVSVATQTVKVRSELNTRPQNPLVNQLQQSDKEVEDGATVDTETTSNESSHLESTSLQSNPLESVSADDTDDFQTTNKLTVNKQPLKKTEHLKKTERKSNEIAETKEKKKKYKFTPNVCAVDRIHDDQNITVRTRKNTKEENIIEVSDSSEDSKDKAAKKKKINSKSVESVKNISNMSKEESPVVTSNKIASDTVSKVHSDSTLMNKGRTTRKRRKNLDCDDAEIRTPLVSTSSGTEVQTATNTRKAKNKVTVLDEENTTSKTKRTKLDHALETPQSGNNPVTRRGRKLVLDQQELDSKSHREEPIVTPSRRKAKEKLKSEVSLITISSSNSTNSDTITKKRRKHDTHEDVQKATSANKIRKAALAEDNGTSETIRSIKKNFLPEVVDSPISSPSRHRRQQKPKVVFTMLDDPKLQTLIRSLGGSVVDTVQSCTVLVTGNIKRSQKLLSAVGEAKPICGPDWLHASKKAGTFLDPWDHLLHDKEAEKKWKFSLKESLNRSSSQKLLVDISFHILTTNNIDVLKAAIESCGGKLVTRVPAKAENVIVVANPEIRTKYLKFLQQKPPAKVVEAEAIFDGVLRQELNWNDHLLA